MQPQISIKLFGASGHAKVIMDIIEAQGDSVACLYDDAPHCSELHGKVVHMASESQVEGPLIISIGSNCDRKYIADKYTLDYAKAIHPQSIISPSAVVGDGSMVMQGAIIQSDTSIGRHCIINSGATIDHECKIGDFVHILPHATLCGNVQVGEESWIGAGATIIPSIKIGKWSTIGAGATVIRDVKDNSIVAGIPAKIIKK